MTRGELRQGSQCQVDGVHLEPDLDSCGLPGLLPVDTVHQPPTGGLKVLPPIPSLLLALTSPRTMSPETWSNLETTRATAAKLTKSSLSLTEMQRNGI